MIHCVPGTTHHFQQSVVTTKKYTTLKHYARYQHGQHVDCFKPYFMSVDMKQNKKEQQSEPPSSFVERPKDNYIYIYILN